MVIIYLIIMKIERISKWRFLYLWALFASKFEERGRDPATKKQEEKVLDRVGDTGGGGGESVHREGCRDLVAHGSGRLTQGKGELRRLLRCSRK